MIDRVGGGVQVVVRSAGGSEECSEKGKEC